MSNDSIEEEIKNYCVTKIQQFIKARGKIEHKTGQAILFPHSLFSQNIALTEEKITAANQLSSILSKAGSVNEAYNALNNAPDLGGDFDALIGECLYVLDNIVRTHQNNSL